MLYQKATALRENDPEECEYRLYIQAGESTTRQMEVIQQDLLANYGLVKMDRERPVLAIATFTAKERMEETLTRWIQNICRLQKSFVLELNNFSAVPPGTLYIRVQNPEPVRLLAVQLKMLDGFMEANGCSQVELERTPRVDLIQGIAAVAFEKMAIELSHQTFYEKITIEKLMLSKRNRPGGSWQYVTAFALTPSFES